MTDTHISLRRWLACLLALVTVISLAIPGLAATTITSPSKITGAQFTRISSLADALDGVFSGDIDIYSNSGYTNEVSMPLGYVMNKDTQFYVRSSTTGNGISGWQCYIYANAAYNKLFNEWVGHGNSFAHSRVVVAGGLSTLSYELLRDAGVRCGAYVRTTTNASGAYDGSSGHSFLILAYDAETVTYLEGNADGQGIVRVTVRDWADFNKNQLSGKSRYLAHIVQPTDTYYDALYVPCDHAYDALGKCGACGTEFNWEKTLDRSAMGLYAVTDRYVPKADGPYTSAGASDVTLTAGQEVTVLGRVENAHGQRWLVIRVDGRDLYVPEAQLTFLRATPLEVSVANFVPADGALLEAKSQPVKGKVTSNYPMKAIYGYLDGKLYTTWTFSDEMTTSVELQTTSINQDLTFSKLAAGKHTVRLEAASFLHEDRVVFHESSCTIKAKELQALSAPVLEYCYSQQRTSMRVQWTAVEGASGYQLYRSTDPDGGWTCVKTVSGGSVRTYTNEGLTEGVTYYYKVRAFRDVDGSRSYSAFSNVGYMPAAVVFDSPYSNSDSRVRLRWEQVGGAHGYQIWRKDDGGDFKLVKTIGDRGNTLTSDQGHVTAYSNTGLEAGESYVYRMRAFAIADGEKVFGPYSQEVTVVVQPSATTLTATSTAGKVRLGWEETAGADGYQIWMSEKADSGFKIVKSIDDDDVTAYTKNGLTGGKTYYFKIRAYAEEDGVKSFGAWSDVIAIKVK